jgi:hypothetical protein
MKINKGPVKIKPEVEAGKIEACQSLKDIIIAACSDLDSNDDQYISFSDIRLLFHLATRSAEKVIGTDLIDHPKPLCIVSFNKGWLAATTALQEIILSQPPSELENGVMVEKSS